MDGDRRVPSMAVPGRQENEVDGLRPRLQRQAGACVHDRRVLGHFVHRRLGVHRRPEGHVAMVGRSTQNSTSPPFDGPAGCLRLATPVSISNCTGPVAPRSTTKHTDKTLPRAQYLEWVSASSCGPLVVVICLSQRMMQ